MARRIIRSILFSCLLFAASGVQAQVWTPQSNQAGTMPAMFSSQRSAYPTRSQYGGPTDAAVPLNYATARTAVPGVPYMGADGIVNSRVPIQPDWNELTPFESTLQHILHNSWVRLEWLQWTINRPGNTLLGAPLATVGDPANGFPVFDLQNPPNLLGTAQVPTVEPIQMRQIDGLRGTIGVPTSFGAIEANFFALEQANSTFQIGGLRPQVETGGLIVGITPGQFAATSLRDNGQLSDIVELYNRGFKATYKSDMLGGEANIVMNDLIEYGLPGGLEILPTFGFRYLLIQEELLQEGRFQDITGQAPELTSIIDSTTSNNLFGPSIGTRVEFQHEWFTLGVSPKVTLATNTYRARVSTERLRLAVDPKVETEDRSVKFSPIGELEAYARIRLNDNMRLSVGYQLLYVSGVTRPHNNIYYNDRGAFPTPPAVVVKPSTTYLRVDGLTLGLEVMLP